MPRSLSGVPVNAIRGATGHAPTTWAAIVAGGVPVPAVGVMVYAGHFSAVRGELDAARSFIPDLAAISYVNPVSGDAIAAVKVTQLQGGMQ